MRRKRFQRLLAAAGLAAVMAAALAAPVLAFESRGGNNVTVPAGEVVEDDLYVGAATFVLDGSIEGDLVVFAGTILVNGSVEGDLIASGQTIIVNGQVMDDVRVAGAALTLGENGQVGDDFVAAGYSLETETGSAIGGDAVIAGSQALLAGGIAGDVLAAASGLELQGSVEGNVSAEVGTEENIPDFSPFLFMPNAPAIPNVRGGLTVGEGARIGGNLEYTSRAPAEIPAGVIVGQQLYREPAVDRDEAWETALRTGVLGWLLDNLRTLVSLLIVGLLMVWLAPRFTRAGAAALQARPLPSLGWGIVSIFAFFFALLVLASAVIALSVILGLVTLGDLLGTTLFTGLLLALALILAFSVAAGYISKIIVSYLGGRLVLARLKPEWAESRVWPLVVGVLIFTILAAIPILGWFVSLIAILLGLGALWLLGAGRFGPRLAPPPAVAD